MALRPEWMPQRIFDLLMARWRHPDREARCVNFWLYRTAHLCTSGHFYPQSCTFFMTSVSMASICLLCLWPCAIRAAELNGYHAAQAPSPMCGLTDLCLSSLQYEAERVATFAAADAMHNALFVLTACLFCCAASSRRSRSRGRSCWSPAAWPPASWPSWPRTTTPWRRCSSCSASWRRRRPSTSASCSTPARALPRASTRLRRRR